MFCLNVGTALAVDPNSVPQAAGIQEHLDYDIDLTTPFFDQHGNAVTLKTLIKENRPAIITPVYFECPRLCTFVLNGMLELLNSLDLKLGDDFTVISYSINPKETPDLALKKSEAYFSKLRAPETGKKGWYFLTGSEESIKKLSTEVGFNFQPDGTEFAHSAAIMLVSPLGKITRYFYGIEYAPKDVRLALVDAAKGKIGNTLDKVFLFCFRYDHAQGKYTPLVWNITRVVCGGFAAFLLLALAWLRLKERKRT